MNPAQITLIIIWAIGLLIASNEHGKPKTGTNNFWHMFIAIVLNFAILWWGGFWS